MANAEFSKGARTSLLLFAIPWNSNSLHNSHLLASHSSDQAPGTSTTHQPPLQRSTPCRPTCFPAAGARENCTLNPSHWLLPGSRRSICDILSLSCPFSRALVFARPVATLCLVLLVFTTQSRTPSDRITDHQGSIVHLTSVKICLLI